MIYLLMLANFIGAMAVDIHLPALPTIEDDFQTSTFLVQMSILATCWGSSLFRLFWGPTCEAWGYRRVLTMVMLLVSSGHFACYCAPNIEVFLMSRFVMALGNGAMYVIAGSLISTIYTGPERASKLGLMELSFPIALVLSPIIGAWIFQAFGWRAIFLFLLSTQFFIQALLWPFLGNLSPEKKELSLKQSFSVYRQMLGFKPFLLSILMPALVIGNYALFVANAPFIYIEEFMLSPTTYAYYQAVPLVVSILGISAFRIMVHQLDIEKVLQFGFGSYVLFSIIILSILKFDIELSPVSLMALVCTQTFCQAFLVSPLIYKASEMFKTNQASIFSLVSFFRGVVIGLAVLLGASIYNDTYESVLECMLWVCWLIFGLAFLNRFYFEPKYQDDAVVIGEK